jgi:hypothetical protein
VKEKWSVRRFKREQRRQPPEISGGGKLGSRGSEEEGKRFGFFLVNGE